MPLVLLLLALATLGCIPPGRAAPKDSADPFVTRVAGQSWLFATSTVIDGRRVNVPVWVSGDQRTWRFVGDALPTEDFPAWATPDATWAPSVQQRADGRWVLYVSVTVGGTSRHGIAAAVAATPAGPFDGRGLAPVQAQGDAASPWRGAIDPSPVVWRGSPYLVWKSDGYPYTAAQPGRVLARLLRPDGLAWATGSREVRLLSAGAGWQGWNIEGPSMVPAPGGADLFYSGGFYEGLHYATGWARCPAGPTAPCTDATRAGPLMSTFGSMLGPGGAEVVHGAGPLELAYHGWTDSSGNYAPFGHATRRLWIGALSIDGRGTPHLG